MMIIIIEQVWVKKKAARKSNRCEVSKIFRLNSTVASQQPGAQLQKHEHCAEQAVAQHFQVGLPGQHSPDMPGVDNDVAGENVWLSKLEKLGPEGRNDYTNCTLQDRINI